MEKIKNYNKKSAGKLDALIFIDTNIFLDFYRLSTDVQIEFLKLIKKNSGIIIFGTQVLMEYKKNRRKEILNTIANLKMGIENIQYPAILRENDLKSIKELQSKIKEIHTQKIEKFNKIYADPYAEDEVFTTVELLEDENSPYFLSERNNKSEEIYELAKKRFLCGYPPRKKDDTTLGDAINWEWTVACSISSNKDIIIVSRDGDYGKRHNGEFYLNDWLLHEFRKRTGKKIVLTSELSKAFDLLSIQGVSEEMKSAEHAIDLESAIETLNKALNMRIDKNNYNNSIYSKYALDNININTIGQMDLFATYEDTEPS